MVKRSKKSGEPPSWFQRVSRLVDERGIVQARITEVAGVEPQRYQKWRDGSALTIEQASAIARYLNVSVDWIATGATGPTGAPGQDDMSQDERHLVWMLRSIGISPRLAASRITNATTNATAGAARIVAVRGPFPVSRDETNGQPAQPDLDDLPSGKVDRVKRRR